jgi:endoglucanase
MKYHWKICLTLWVLVIVAACSNTQTPELMPQATALGRGVNFGNMLEAPNEGDWGLVLSTELFDKAKEAGFNHIRLPISWTYHASSTAPYTIDPVFFQRVDWAISQAKARGLYIIVNNHHYDELNANPEAEEARALAIWRQIANRYRNQPESVYFEILNEPHGAFTDNPQLWNNFLAKALAVIRQRNPTRKVIVGPVGWNNPNRLSQLVLPNDPNLIATIHFYAPFDFTHQGAGWVNPSPPIGRIWTANARTFNPPWDDWSWSTTVKSTTQGLEITYNAGWAGLHLHSDSPASGFTSLVFKTNKALNLNIVCSSNSVNSNTAIQTQDGWNTYTIPLGFCNSPANVTGIMIQNNTSSPQAAFLIDAIELRSATRVMRLTTTEKGAIRTVLTKAANWAIANNRPLYLGEFGAYEAADMDSRVRWTTAVRSEAERLGMDWGYWEFAAGFGIYDPVTHQWREGLRRALIP